MKSSNGNMEHTIGQTIKMPVIWDAIMLIMTSLWCSWSLFNGSGWSGMMKPEHGPFFGQVRTAVGAAVANVFENFSCFLLKKQTVGETIVRNLSSKCPMFYKYYEVWVFRGNSMRESNPRFRMPLIFMQRFHRKKYVVMDNNDLNFQQNNDCNANTTPPLWKY